MSEAEELRALFAGHHFGPPCSEIDLERAQAALGGPLPASLRELYLAFDGFLGSTDSNFLWPLFGHEGLVEFNLFYRGDELFPQDLISECLFFGDNGCGQSWAFKRDLPGKIIEWDAEWGVDYELVGDSLIEVWKNEKAKFDSLDTQ